jgi:hypothetical protein
MHLLTRSHHVQSKSWTVGVTDLNLNILRNVETGWFSGAECRMRNWPFWSYLACSPGGIGAMWWECS